MIELRRVKTIFFAVFIGTLLSFSCFQHKKQWDEIKIVPEITRNPVYQRLDGFSEIYNGLEQLDSSKRTSNVQYSSGHPINLKKDEFSNVNNCRASFFKSDTLLIRIGLSSSYSSKGFMIRCKAGKFYVEPYTWSDAIIEGEPESTYKIVYQKLSLDKPSFSVGDSLHGYIDFKSIETTPEGTVIDHIGKGFFRAKVKK